MRHVALSLLLPGLLAGVVAVSGLVQASPALTPAGTEIINQATATFDPITPGEPDSAVSNVVRTTVQAVCAVSITPDGTVANPGQSASLPYGGSAVFSYILVNAGNQTATYPVTARTEEGSAFTPTTHVYLDANGNGSVDPGEQEVETVTLAPEQSANLLLVVEAASGQGTAYVNLVASCGGDGQVDSNNVSRMTVAPPPQLGVEKTFTPALIRPGGETTVTVTTRNGGQGEAQAVVLTDPLEEQLAQGLAFVPGSAQVTAGTLEYTADGVTWQATEPAGVRGVRVRAARLAPDETLTLTFRMAATPAAENHVIPNVATALANGLTARGSAQVDVRYQPAVALGPSGVPEAPENTPADTQTKAFAVVGQQVCFDHTLKNTGDVRDDFRVTVTYPQGQARATLLNANGQPLAEPLPLDPGQTALIRVCYDLTASGPLEALVTASGSRGTRNATRDLVAGVETGLPELVKTVSPAPTVSLSRGETVTYTLSVRNPYTRPLTGVVVSDPLPPHVDFVPGRDTLSDGGTVSGAAGAQVATWNVGTLAPGETRTFRVTATVSDRAVDGETLNNVFQLVSSELPAPTLSNEVKSPVWNAQLRILKTVSSPEVTPGDRLTYTLTIRNGSATTDIVDAVVTDTPAAGLVYLPGTATLNGQPLADPEITNGVLRWQIPRLSAGQEVTLTYQARVGANTQGELTNSAEVVGVGGAARAVASNKSTATVKLRLLNFAPLNDILGMVYVDRNRNGRFDAGLDTPVERARVILAGGRLVLTDAAGRYHFANVALGTQALRLDPNSVPYPPLSVPQDGGLPGTRTVQVNGLTSVDFPLAPLAGEVAALRRTTLTAGPLRVEKTVTLTPQGYAVTLRLQTTAALEGFELNDPLPPGATLKEGRKSWNGTLPVGETVLTYTFEFTGSPDAAVTDPNVQWRS
ncbi:protein of unknown function DUF11 [Deinococcus geothermalis DSM 11300]|uniref:DUF11 domain-containing protein n=1 Tax=Deinococcus geothermalis (strain DSM 11300 / CIP 105573 / AG-3a) TaxID=319795 RepID=Q1J1M1_DEIGD|nr:DUF11 domain-containing protein [Deinococcus geothermalis]ABF44613.1 protein of unknown function DUF11 [Deinococcus geothermalis DSM 11300]